MGTTDLELFNGVYKGETVLLTGHTGFKGSWLCMWLNKLGAEVVGYSLKPRGEVNHFELLNLDIVSVIGDIRDRDRLNNTVKKYKPKIIFHLAAQPLVRYSYINPVETLETNVIGTINVFEAARESKSVKVILNITTDKCYENKEWIWGYRENDAIGGYDPYSASKACSEIITTAWRHSFFNTREYNILLASVRSGNVIGGGDWQEDRIMPDIIRAIIQKKKLFIRNPNAIRPWQHVLEPLSGYLILGQKLLEGEKELVGAWNFGPCEEDHIDVETIVKNTKEKWNEFEYGIDNKLDNPYEARLLKLDCSKARTFLSWKPIWGIEKALDITVRWYKEYYNNKNIYSFKDLEEYINSARDKNITWVDKINFKDISK